MKIGKSRLIQIIKEEIKEVNDREKGIAPIPMSIRTPEQYEDWIRSGKSPTKSPDDTVPDLAKKTPSRAPQAGTFADLAHMIETSFGKLQKRIEALEGLLDVPIPPPEDPQDDTEYAE